MNLYCNYYIYLLLSLSLCAASSSLHIALISSRCANSFSASRLIRKSKSTSLDCDVLYCLLNLAIISCICASLCAAICASLCAAICAAICAALALCASLCASLALAISSLDNSFFALGSYFPPLE